MKPLSKHKTEIYILDESRMQKLDALISELQCAYCDILSNRGLTVTTGMECTPASGLLNDLAEDQPSIEDVLAD